MIGKSDTHRGYWALAQLLCDVRVSPRSAPSTQPGLLDDASSTASATGHGAAAPLRPFRLHDVYAAIDKKDIDKIMAIRDADFELLLGSSEDGLLVSRASAHTPLDYAIHLGPEYAGVCVFLVGAMSRYVNRLPDDKPVPEEQQATLRKVRANLKLAIDHSLYRDETSLVSSYLQVLVMSQGMPWLEHAVRNVAYELGQWAGQVRDVAGVVPQPLRIAQDAVSDFLTTNLRLRREAERVVVASVDDYIANATSDLVLLGLWMSLPHTGELPLHAFARDTRVTVLFREYVTDCQFLEPPVGRVAKLWRAAQHIDQQLDASVHTQSAGERLEMLRALFH